MYFIQGAGGEQQEKQCVVHRELKVSNYRNIILYTES